ncbi:MAG: TonB-dependent receptor [Dokdonella sp.]|uniref:TonB-dependent receptor n=1 Tax=Dokdonella sp. TaxID=2291710 RepID=UPI003267B094
MHPSFHRLTTLRQSPLALALAISMLGAAPAIAADAPPDKGEDVTTLDLVNVVGVSPVAGTEIAAGKLPYNVQSVNDDALSRSQTLDLTDFMNRHLAGVSTNGAQNNPLQPDVQFRGFTATPLLGGSEGMSVYLDGVRVNEVFGDTVNWDLIPEGAIERMSLLAGANPVFGLNTLGGAISIQTKTGFSEPGTNFEFYGGSFGRTNTNVETAGNSGQWGWYLLGNRFDEDGWRDQSPSNAKNFYGTLSWRGEGATFDLHLGHADTDLTGNGAAPVEELAQNWRSIFTAPDETSNKMDLVSGQGSFNFNDATRLSFTLFHREVKTLSYNGDGSDFEECEDNDDILCGDDGEPILDQNGQPVSSQFDAINNISHRRQKSDGGTLQLAFDQPIGGLANQLVVGLDYTNGRLHFDSVVEAAVLQDDLHTSSNSGIFIAEDALAIRSGTRSTGLYVTDTLSMTDQLALTLSGRSNHTRTTIEDLTGDNPDLNGRHSFSRFNPAAGLTWQWSPQVNFYGGYSESTRAPTSVELTCSDENAPCKLPNQFLSDPPLKQVVAKGWEGGVRGKLGDGASATNWHLGLFRTTNTDDILFQSTGGSQSNEGFFANVGDTRRQGLEASISGSAFDKRVSWFANYTYLDATYLTSFAENSANHPDADEDGLIFVSRGDHIPSLPKNSLKFGADFAVTPSLNVGGDVVANSGQYLRSDEANLLGETAGYSLLNLRANYTFNSHVSVFGRVDNVFDKRYVTFGTLGNASEVFPDFSDPRFFGPGQPRGAWIGVKVAL